MNIFTTKYKSPFQYRQALHFVGLDSVELVELVDDVGFS